MNDYFLSNGRILEDRLRLISTLVKLEAFTAFVPYLQFFLVDDIQILSNLSGLYE